MTSSKECFAIATAAFIAVLAICLGGVVNGQPSDDKAAIVAGATYRVGPSREYKDINAVTALVKPGDTIEVDGDANYPSVIFRQSGTADKPITIRGIRVNGKRPVISGGTNTVEFRLSNYNVFEGFEVTGGKNRGLYHHAAFITVRDTFVHDCPGQGITGSDQDSGSLLLEYSEVARCGGGMYSHPIYMSTDPQAYPGSVFRMQFCYIHDGTGGNAVKSRSERNELYYNWIESGFYREIELIGRDIEAAPRPMNSDVVGNVFFKTSQYPVARIGHDSKGLGTRGRYRFVNNTFVLSPEASVAIQAYGKLESVEMHNNVFYRKGGGVVRVLNEEDAEWTTGKRVCSGERNWVVTGSDCPDEWKGTLDGLDPRFVNIGSANLAPAAESPLINEGTMTPASPEGFPFPNALFPPAFEPMIRAVAPTSGATARKVVGAIDIGAFEAASGGK